MEIKEKYNYNKIKMAKKEYKPSHDTLVTFGEEAYTMRKDDPRTKEAIEKSKELKEEKMKEWIKSGEVSMFCLLYTSPSPRDRQKTRMPSSA